MRKELLDTPGDFPYPPNFPRDRRPVNELERFFRQLVGAIAAVDADRLRQPLRIADIRGSILPYRSFRRALQLDTSEDYELVLLRLCAGEGGYAASDAADMVSLFQSELASPHPDLGVLDAGEDVEIRLLPHHVAAALEPQPDLNRAYAPPSASVPAEQVPASLRKNRTEAGSHEERLNSPEPSRFPEFGDPSDPDDALPLDDVRAPTTPRAPVRSPESEDEQLDGDRQHCSYCGGALPDGRIVNFCPHCGQSQAVTHCPECRSEVDIGWRHCITCGFALGG